MRARTRRACWAPTCAGSSPPAETGWQSGSKHACQNRALLRRDVMEDLQGRLAHLAAPEGKQQLLALVAASSWWLHGGGIVLPLPLVATRLLGRPSDKGRSWRGQVDRMLGEFRLAALAANPARQLLRSAGSTRRVSEWRWATAASITRSRSLCLPCWPEPGHAAWAPSRRLQTSPPCSPALLLRHRRLTPADLDRPPRSSSTS